MVNGKSGCGAYDILKIQRTILKIQEIMNADPFSAKEVRDEICAINLEHPENLVIYGLLFPQNSSGTRIVDADQRMPHSRSAMETIQFECEMRWKKY